MTALLLEAALRSAILWAALWLAIRVLRVRDARTEKLVWTVAVAASLAMPVLMQTASSPLSERLTVAIPGGLSSDVLPTGSRHSTFAIALSIGYAIVVLMLLLRFVSNLRRAFRIRRRARQTTMEFLPRVAVRLSDEIRAPCTFGRCILLPADFGSWTAPARAAALAHERAHVGNLDCHRLWLATAYCALFWFNPTAWLLRRRLQLLAELTSDEEALQTTSDSASYAEMLLGLAAHASPLRAAIAMSGATQLTARITRILENSMTSDRLSIGRKATLSGTCLIVALLCISCASAPHVLTPTEDPKVSWVSGAPLADFYPATLKDKRVEGFVVVRLAIDPMGRVTDANVVTEDPTDSGLGLAATNAARTFHFNNTLARPVIKTLQVRFALKD